MAYLGNLGGKYKYFEYFNILTRPPLKLLAEHFQILFQLLSVFAHIGISFSNIVKQEEANWNETHVVEMEYNCAAIQ